MPLQKQLLPIPLVGGLNESEDALVSSHPQTMTNCRYRKAPAVSKRYGYDCLAPFNTRLDGTNPAACELLAPFKNELIRIGGGQLDTFGIVGTTDWFNRGRVSECIVEVDGVVSTGINATPYTNPAVNVANGVAITAYVSYDGTTYRCFADVTVVATGARVFSRYLLFASSSPVTKPTVCAFAGGTNLMVFWGDASINTLRGVWFDTTAMAWDITAFAVVGITTAGLSGFDAVAVSDTRVLFCFDNVAGPVYYGITQTRSAGAFVAFLGATFLNLTDAGSTAFSIRLTASRIWVTYALQVGGSALATVKVATITPAYAIETAPFVLYQDAVGGRMITCVGIEATTATTAIVVYNTDALYSGSAECLNTGTPSNIRNAPNILWLTTPLNRNGRTYAVLTNQHRASNSSQFLVDLSAGETLPSNGSPRIVASFLPLQLPVLFQKTARYRTLSGWASIATDQYLATSLVAGPSPTSLSVVGVKARFDTAWIRTVAELDNHLYVGGGALQAYDGSQVFEVGYAHSPDGDVFSGTGGAGGSLTASSSYGYKFVFVWTDSTGTIHRSAPSTAQTIALTAGQTKVTANAPCLWLTNKGATSANSPVAIEVYRTLSNGSTYFYLTTLANVPSAASVAFVDIAADTAISTNATIYTTGGVLEGQIPAGGANVLAWKSCLLLASSDDDSLWISREVLPSEGPAFNAQLNISSFEMGRITALATLDATPIVFKNDAAFYLDGEPPTDLGVSSIGAPRRIQTEAGCTDARSIASSKYGIARMARTGIFIMNSSLTDAYLGRSVENSYRGVGFAGAAVLPAQGLVRWVQKGTGGSADALNWDFIHSEDAGAPVWSKDAFLNAQTGAVAANPVAASVWQGAFVWADASGYVYRENTASFVDANYTQSNKLWVPMTFEASVQKPFGLGGWQRVWRVIVTGLRASAHAMTLTVTTDAGVESWAWTDAEVQAMTGMPDERFMAHVTNQKCAWMRVKWADALPTSPVGGFGTYEGMRLRDVTLEVGQKPAGSRFNAANRK